MPQSFEAWEMESSSREQRDLNFLKQIAEIWWNQTRTITPPCWVYVIFCACAYGGEVRMLALQLGDPKGTFDGNRP